MTKQVIVDENTYTIKAGERVALTIPVSMTQEELARHCFRLQLRGRAGIHPSWMYEGGLPYLYRDIDDALSTQTHHSRFSLKIKTDGEDFPRRAYYRIDCPPRINSQYPVPPSDDICWQFHGMVKTEDFHVSEGGAAQVRFDCYLKKEGRDFRDISGEPDESIEIALPEGTTDWTELSGQVIIDSDTAAVFVTIATEHTRGTVWLEDFSLKNSTGFNILPPFDITNRYHEFMNWTGENLSEKEWTTLVPAINGTKLEPRRLFQRCFAGAENEIRLPEGILRPGENRLELENVSDYFCPAPYELSRLALHMEEVRPAQIIYCPEYVAAGREFGVLIRTVQAGMRVRTTLGEGLLGDSEYTYPEAGLHVIRILAGNEAFRAEVSVEAQGQKDTACIRRIVVRSEDGVVTGSGDAVYIPQETEEMEAFLCWYLSGHLGNMITFRPVYRWCGSRTCHPDVWKRMARLCNDLNVSYCYISDGRELPGINANPSDEMLQGGYYLGSQGHERDGAFYYWLQTVRMCNETLYEQICRRVCKHPDYTYRTPFEYGENDFYYNFSPVKCRNMAEGAAQFVEKAKASLTGIRRHTGPSVLFKYLYQAGVEVCGAELMYGPQEVILSALRGASIAYDRENFAAHLAVQWGTTPHDSEAHFRRFRLALYISYLQGCHHINTEEGFYRMEEMFAQSDRFSKSCVGHANVQREFVRFVETHSRRGRMVNPVALLHGANDAWVCFTRRNAWSQEGKKWEFNTPEESWDLLKVFYPDAVLDAIYRHPCPDAPQGYYSRTPYGTVDILPVEADVSKYRTYSHMAFLGYNTADVCQVEKLLKYVEDGGKLLLGWCHLLTDTDREDAIWGTPHPLDAWALTGVRLKAFRQKQNGLTLGELAIERPEVTVLQKCEGTPLLLKYHLGKGEVYFVNAREYPADRAVRGIYEEILHQFGCEAAKEQAREGWLTGSDTVESAVYDREDNHRIIYAVNTDWWSAQPRAAKAELRLAEQTFSVPVPRDSITQITIRGEIAAATRDLETEVLEILPMQGGFQISAQGGEAAQITIYSARGLTSEDTVLQPGNGGCLLKADLCGKRDFKIRWKDED